MESWNVKWALIRVHSFTRVSSCNWFLIKQLFSSVFSLESEGSEVEVDVESSKDEKPAFYTDAAKVKVISPSEKQTTSKTKQADGDDEFVITQDMDEGGDDEQTLEEEEKMEGEGDHSNEIAALQKEGNDLFPY